MSSCLSELELGGEEMKGDVSSACLVCGLQPHPDMLIVRLHNPLQILDTDIRAL